MTALTGLRIGHLERRHPADHQGSVSAAIVSRLRGLGAAVDVVHAELELHRVDAAPPWDVVLLKSGTASALHVAAAAEAQGAASLNSSDATRITRDKLAATAILRRGGLPVPRAHMASLGPAGVEPAALDRLQGGPWVVKSARGFGGDGLWFEPTLSLGELAAKLPHGAYLLMEHVEHEGDDLKVFVAGSWMSAIRRPFPANDLAAKLGRPAAIPGGVAACVRRVGELLGLSFFGCDLVEGRDGWALVDVNAFPGYKGAPDAAAAVVIEIARLAGARS